MQKVDSIKNSLFLIVPATGKLPVVTDLPEHKFLNRSNETSFGIRKLDASR